METKQKVLTSSVRLPQLKNETIQSWAFASQLPILLGVSSLRQARENIHAWLARLIRIAIIFAESQSTSDIRLTHVALAVNFIRSEAR